MLTYNRIKYLPAAITGVLKQSFTNWELIIIDSQSSDGTGNLVKNYCRQDDRVKFVLEDKNFNISQCRNLGLNLAQGKYIAVLDSDDIWEDSDKLKKQIEFLKNHADCVLLGGMAMVINESGEKIGQIKYKTRDEQIRNKILFSNQFVHSAVVYKKDIAQAVSGYNFVGVGEDYDLILKIGLKGKFFNLPEELISYRRHSAGATWENRTKSARDHLSIIQKYKELYPHYYLALAKAYLRIVLTLLRLN